jgi:hypothetical protein
MTMKFGNILAGKAVRALEIDDQSFIDAGILAIVETRELRVAGLKYRGIALGYLRCYP